MQPPQESASTSRFEPPRRLLHRRDAEPGDPLRFAKDENFPVALKVLPRRSRRHLQAIYRYARYVDDLGDDVTVPPTDRVAALEAVRREVQKMYDGKPPTDAVVTLLAPTVADCGIPSAPLLRLIQANLQDQCVDSYQTFDELVDYCRLSANPVGELVLHVFGQVRPERIALSDRVCTALQLLEHWQDVAEDHRRGRVYLPQEDLRRCNVKPSDLSAPHASTELRALLAFETDRALAWLDAGSPLVSALSGWARVAVSGYIAGGRAAAAALERSDYDPLPGTPKPSGRQVAAAWLKGTVTRPG